MSQRLKGVSGIIAKVRENFPLRIIGTGRGIPVREARFDLSGILEQRSSNPVVAPCESVPAQPR